MESEEYNIEAEQEIEQESNLSPTIEGDTKTLSEPPTTGGWLDLGREAELETKSDSETEPDEDSDNVDANEAWDETEADEDWFKIPSTSTEADDSTMSTEVPGEVWRPDCTRSTKRSVMIRCKWARRRTLWNMIQSSFFDTCEFVEDTLLPITNKKVLLP